MDAEERTCPPGGWRCFGDELQFCHDGNQWKKYMQCKNCLIVQDDSVYCGTVGHMHRVGVHPTLMTATSDKSTSSKNDTCDPCSMRCGKEHLEACNTEKRWKKILPCSQCGMEGPFATCYDSDMGSGKQMQLAAGETMGKKCRSGTSRCKDKNIQLCDVDGNWSSICNCKTKCPEDVDEILKCLSPEHPLGFAAAGFPTFGISASAEKCSPGTKRRDANLKIVEECDEHHRWKAF
ncbi:hypothetical protein F5X99DRAFT_411721 [Biscogniauxia marginata]|nr:hypothetical protein F5X99DRAFT_411721 [Biscogniauxia marginata]